MSVLRQYQIIFLNSCKKRMTFSGGYVMIQKLWIMNYTAFWRCMSFAYET